MGCEINKNGRLFKNHRSLILTITSSMSAIINYTDRRIGCVVPWGKVKWQTPRVLTTPGPKKPKGRAKRRAQYNRNISISGPYEFQSPNKQSKQNGKIDLLPPKKSRKNSKILVALN
jgi:hypothetical protein